MEFDLKSFTPIFQTHQFVLWLNFWALCFFKLQFLSHCDIKKLFTGCNRSKVKVNNDEKSIWEWESFPVNLFPSQLSAGWGSESCLIQRENYNCLTNNVPLSLFLKCGFLFWKSLPRPIIVSQSGDVWQAKGRVLWPKMLCSTSGSLLKVFRIRMDISSSLFFFFIELNCKHNYT